MTVAEHVAGYEPGAYWRERGAVYEAEYVRTPAHADQEAQLLAYLGALEFGSVLEVGCGFGRIGELVLATRPGVAYVGLDPSRDQLRGARRRMPDVPLIAGTLEHFAGEIAARGDSVRRWDLVLAVEVLMHIPPDRIRAAIAALRDLSVRHVVTVDWASRLEDGRPPAAHNFLHDYRALFGPGARIVPVGRQAICHVEVPS